MGQFKAVGTWFEQDDDIGFLKEGFPVHAGKAQQGKLTLCLELDERQKLVVDQGGPDLDEDGIGRCAEKCSHSGSTLKIESIKPFNYKKLY
jgi:hypothetical protein